MSIAIWSLVLLDFYSAWSFGSSSFVHIDWTFETPQDLEIKQFLLDYTPPFGKPSPNSILPSNTRQATINSTLPGAQYRVAIGAVLHDGSQLLLLNKRTISTPERPILDTITSESTEATVSFFPPDGEELSYYVEYYPVEWMEQLHYIETLSSHVKLLNLEPNTEYRLRILSVYRGVPSADAVDTSFWTKELPESTIVFSSITTERPTQTTSPSTIPSTTMTTTTTTPSTSSSTTTTTSTTPSTTTTTTTTPSTSSSTTTTTPLKTSTEETTPATSSTTESLKQSPASENYKTVPIPTTTTEQSVRTPSTTEATTSTSTQTTSTSPTVKTTSEKATTSTEPSPETEITTTQEITSFVSETNTEESTTTTIASTRARNISHPKPIASVTKSEETTTYKSIAKETGTPKIPRSTTEEFVQYVPPTNVETTISRISFQTEGKQLRVSWSEAPTDCFKYKMNYSVNTFERWKNFTVSVDKEFAFVKLFKGSLIKFAVFCMINSDSDLIFDYSWKAEGTADLRKPSAIQNLRISEVVTNVFFQSHIVVKWDWPKYHNFEKFTVLLSYFHGTAKKARKDIIMKSMRPFNLTDLKPAQLYTITVRNISLFDVTSTVKGMRQITPPIIESILYPGRISSTAININFSPTSDQHTFDVYELVFFGNDGKNISRTIPGDDESNSYTFKGLVPGRTYKFALYTVFKGVRSWPATTEVTTYPLKVERLLPVVGRDYVDLFWEIKNLTEGDVKYRLTYSGDDGSGSSNILVRNTLRYRFSHLSSSTWYTFTVTVMTGDAESAAESVTAVTGKSNQGVPKVVQLGAKKLQVTFKKNIFTTINGGIKTYAIIVSENPTVSSDTFLPKSWFDVRNLRDVWPPFQATPSGYNPFGGWASSTATFDVGKKFCSQVNSADRYCNGRLRADTEYFVKLRAFTTSNITLETDYAAVAEYKPNKEDPRERNFKTRIHYLNGAAERSWSLLCLSAAAALWFCDKLAFRS